MLLLLLSAALLVASYNGVRQKRRLDRLEADLVQVQVDAVASETTLASVMSTIATNSSVTSLLAKRASLVLDENDVVCGIEVLRDDGTVCIAFRTTPQENDHGDHA